MSDVRCRVRRKDLYDPASGSESDEGKNRDPQFETVLREKLNAQLSGLFDFSFIARLEAAQQQQQAGGPQASGSASDAQQETDQPGGGGGGGVGGGGGGEQVFAFRLFRDEALTHTVVLAPDEDPTALGDGGFVVPLRPRSYYIASAPSPRKISEYRGAAVSAEYVLADARRRRWGLEKPWRVIHITAPSKPIPGSAQGDDSAAEEKGQKQKRKRPGKKHRILLRVREKAAHEREEAAKKQALEKGLHIQEKKKRLNRERKLKRRQKKREKKVEGQATDPDGSSKDVGSEASVSGNEE
ncbi:hypothetical protein F5B18DRAFT_1910 [Nemania serpens]|nr:hypothetical protein F5B18DRAFT_1910 [Nemania serpens]